MRGKANWHEIELRCLDLMACTCLPVVWISGYTPKKCSRWVRVSNHLHRHSPLSWHQNILMLPCKSCIDLICLNLLTEHICHNKNCDNDYVWQRRMSGFIPSFNGFERSANDSESLYVMGICDLIHSFMETKIRHALKRRLLVTSPQNQSPFQTGN